MIRLLRLADSGEYSCKPSNALPDSVTIHVLTGSVIIIIILLLLLLLIIIIIMSPFMYWQVSWYICTNILYTIEYKIYSIFRSQLNSTNATNQSKQIYVRYKLEKEQPASPKKKTNKQTNKRLQETNK